MLGLKSGDRLRDANGIALTANDDLLVAVVKPLQANQPVRVRGAREGAELELLLVNASACARALADTRMDQRAGGSQSSNAPGRSIIPAAGHVVGRLVRLDVTVDGDDRQHAGGVAGVDIALGVADIEAALGGDAELRRRVQQRRRVRLRVRRSCRRRPRCRRGAAAASGRCSGCVKRAALLVTMPQASPRASIASSSAATSANSADSTQSAAA